MIRRSLMVGALLLIPAAAVKLAYETRMVIRGAEPVRTTLARYAGTDANVVIVFQPDDCLGNGEIVRRWNALATAQGVGIAGLLVGRSESSIQQELFQQAGLKMPLVSISMREAGLLGARLGYRRTPFAVVLDPHRRVAASFPAGQNVPPTSLSRLASGN